MNGTRIDGKREDCAHAATGKRKEKMATHRIAPLYQSIRRRPPQSLAAPLSWAQKVFYVVAYFNLGLVFLAILVIAFWRWGA